MKLDVTKANGVGPGTSGWARKMDEDLVLFIKRKWPAHHTDIAKNVAGGQWPGLPRVTRIAR